MRIWNWLVKVFGGKQDRPYYAYLNGSRIKCSAIYVTNISDVMTYTLIDALCVDANDEILHFNTIYPYNVAAKFVCSGKSVSIFNGVMQIIIDTKGITLISISGYEMTTLESNCGR